MNVFVITTNSGLWSVYATRELAEIDSRRIEGEDNIKIHECGVITSLPEAVKGDENDA
mgnify:FL=1